MSAFSYAPPSRQIIASWRTGASRRAEPVGDVPDSCDDEGADQFAAGLRDLSDAAWQTYSDIDESACGNLISKTSSTEITRSLPEIAATAPLATGAQRDVDNPAFVGG